MIYTFPNLDTLRLAITSGVVPPEVSLVPAIGGLDEDGHVWLQPSVALSRKAQNGLRRLGVEAVKADGDLQAEQYHCWLQMLPVAPDPQAGAPTPQTPVLFYLPDPGQLPGLVSEMLRLGNDRQHFRWLKEDANTHALLRVIGPPYYSLLRALERDGQETAPIAFVERAPRVWVEIGHSHPLVEQIRPAEGQFVLMRPPRSWIFLQDAPFQDIYEIIDFALPGSEVAWTDTKMGERLKVALRLAPGGTGEADQLWVLREQALEQLDILVREAKDDLLEQLAFAVAEHDGKVTAILRARPSKKGPPAVELKNAQAFRQFSRLPNLFIPKGRRIHPPLRRDAVRKLLADDPDIVTWLYPNPDDTFTPESLPDAAFRPLGDWVDYVLDHERQALQTWIESATFDFESYVCKDERPPDTPKGPGKREPKGGRNKGGPVEDEEIPAATPVKVVKKTKKAAQDEFVALAEVKKSELEIRRGELEAKFLAIDGPLDSTERQALWPELAALNTVLGHTSDAAICWLNALWEAEEAPSSWPNRWAHTEANLRNGEVAGVDFDRLLAVPDPNVAHLRAVAACIISATSEPGDARDALVARLPALRQYLERHENLLGVRAVWLAWASLAHLSAGDVLGLARARDRLLERLLANGMNPEHDLPAFLRYAGQRNSDRYRAARDQVASLRDAAHQWITLCYTQDTNAHVAKDTRAYADLIFAFGMARLGEAIESRKLEEKAKQVLQHGDDVHSFLLNAFAYRIQQVREGKIHAGPLPPEFLEQLGLMERFPLYKIDRLRRHSRIVEPQEKVDPYRKWYARTDDLTRDLVALVDLTDRQELQKRLTQLLQANAKKAKQHLQVLTTALELAPRVNEAFTVDVLDRLAAAQDALPPMQEQRELQERADALERALFLAAHYDRAEHVQNVVGRFVQLLESQRGQGASESLAALAGQCFRGLRKVGLRDEIDRLLHQMADVVLGGQDLAALRRAAGTQWARSLCTLLAITGGWFYFGRTEKAVPVLAEAEALLFDEEPPKSGKGEDTVAMQPLDKMRLACAYATTLGQAPVEMALQRFLRLFKKLGRISDTFTTNTHYSLSQLQVIEAVVLAVVSDDFNLGQNARRWLDEDEYLVRRRIHRDLRTLMAQTGM